MKNLLTILILALGFHGISQEQEVKIKKDDVFVDGEKCLKANSKFGEGTSFTDLAGNELVYFEYVTGVPNYPDYYKIIFVQDEIMITNQSLIISRKGLISMLIENEVLNDCTVDSSKIQMFKFKYHEEVLPIQNVNVTIEEN